MRHEFEEFGPIRRIRLVHAKNSGMLLAAKIAIVIFDFLSVLLMYSNGVMVLSLLQLACWHPTPQSRFVACRLNTHVPVDTFTMSISSSAEKPRGYAFIEYEHKKDMKEAYKMSDGRKIETRRILVDVERGRTVENW